MSTYLEVSARAVGTPQAVRALTRMAERSEANAPIRAEEFSAIAQVTGRMRIWAVAYHSGLSRYPPRLRSFLLKKNPAVDVLDVCIYVACFSECYFTQALCFRRGRILAAEHREAVPHSQNKAYRAFVKHCASLGVRPQTWRGRSGAISPPVSLRSRARSRPIAARGNSEEKKQFGGAILDPSEVSILDLNPRGVLWTPQSPWGVYE